MFEQNILGEFKVVDRDSAEYADAARTVTGESGRGEFGVSRAGNGRGNACLQGSGESLNPSHCFPIRSFMRSDRTQEVAGSSPASSMA
jgi:hypothetical protein